MHYKAEVFQQISRNKRVWLLVIYNKKGQKMRKSEKISVFGFAAGPEQAGLQHLASCSKVSGFVSLTVSFLDGAKLQLLHRTRALDDILILPFT